MNNEKEQPAFPRWLNILLPLLLAILFAGSFEQWPLYTSNQNAFYVHGLGKAEMGYVGDDWLMDCTDHVPLFSAFVCSVYKYSTPLLFHVVHGLLVMVLAISLFDILRTTIFGGKVSPAAAVSFLVMTLAYAPRVWLALERAVPSLWRLALSLNQLGYLATNGLAGQYIIGGFFEPSSVGVFLLVAIVLFLRGHEYWGAAVAALTANLHSTYMLQAGLIVAGFLVTLLVEGKKKRAFYVGLLALVLVLPVVLYVLNQFGPTGDESFREAQRILAEERIPHHSDPSVWFNLFALVQLMIMAAGTAIARQKKRMFLTMIGAAAPALLLTVVTILSGNLTLRLLFPWRASIWLVPVSSILIIGYCMKRLEQRIRRWLELRKGEREKKTWLGWATLCLVVVLMILLCIGGISATVSATERYQYAHSEARFAHSRLEKGDLYLIPVDMEWFRLLAQAPVFVDWKTHPYWATELMHWNERIKLAKAFYSAKTPAEALEIFERIRKIAAVTHVVVPLDGLDLDRTSAFRKIYQDNHYRIYRVTSLSPPK